MNLLDFQVHNIMRVSDLSLPMEGRNLVLIGGPNASGKTSSLTALAMCLCGKRELGEEWPDIALKEGQDKGWVKVKISGDASLHEDKHLTVEMFLRRKRGGVVAEEFRVLDSTGEEAPSPRKLLNDLYHMRGFDPLDFERAKPKERADKIRELVGLDFTKLDAERDEAYKTRTKVNADGKAKAAQFDAISVEESVPDEPFSVTDLFEELEQAKKHNDSCARERAKVNKMIVEEKRLADEEEALKNRLIEIDKLRQDLDEEMDRQEKLVEGLVEADVDMIKEKIRNADDINAKVDAKKRKAALGEELNKLRAQTHVLTRKINEIDESKQERLESAEWPVDGMSLDDSGVLMNGLPFEQASTRERIQASVRVGMALKPRLKLFICQHGNDLDNDALQTLEKELKENGFQMLLEFVTRDEADEARCAVVFRDGSPKTEDKTEDKPEEEPVT